MQVRPIQLSSLAWPSYFVRSYRALGCCLALRLALASRLLIKSIRDLILDLPFFILLLLLPCLSCLPVGNVVCYRFLKFHQKLCRLAPGATGGVSAGLRIRSRSGLPCSSLPVAYAAAWPVIWYIIGLQPGFDLRKRQPEFGCDLCRIYPSDNSVLGDGSYPDLLRGGAIF